METISCIRKSGKVPPLAQQDDIGRDRNIERPDATGGAQGLLGSTSFLGGNWSEPVFDRRAPGGGEISFPCTGSFQSFINQLLTENYCRHPLFAQQPR
jgi:hypothetical protein